MPPISEMAELRHAVLEDWRGSLIYFSARVTYNETGSDNESRRVSMKGKMLVKQTMAAFSACILCCAAFASCGSPISEKGSAGDAPAQASYESGELVAMARAYYEAQGGFFAPEADCTENEDGTYTIYLYEIVKDEEGDSWHTATSCWYTVDASGRGRDDISEAEIALPPLSPADTAAYIGTPVKLRYIRDGEARSEREIRDAQTLTACIEALRQLQIGEKTDIRGMDAGETFLFTFQDGSVWTLSFEMGNLLKDGVCYETVGYGTLHRLAESQKA